MCPDETRGSCYSGPTRVSLINTTTRTVINTIEIKDGHFEALGGPEGKADSFAIPYAIRKGYYYHVGDEGHRTESLSWCDYLFSEKPISPGHWKYEIDYRGRGGPLDKYEIRYDTQHEMFVGKLVWTAYEY